MSQFDQNYFVLSRKLPEQLMQKIQNLKYQIINDIENGNVQIFIAQDIIQKKIDKRYDHKNMKNKLKQLDITKVQLVKKLKLIQAQEKQIKILSNKIEKQNTKNKLQKSILTEQDKQKILSIKKSQKYFQAKIKQKIKKIMQQIRYKEKEQQQQTNFKNDMKRKERIVKLTQKRLKINQSRNKTLQMLSNSCVFLKKQNYIYVKNQKKDKKILEQREKDLKNVLSEKKQKFKIDFIEIKKHSLIHDKVINQKKKQFLFELKQSQIKKRRKTIAYESYFYRKLKQEERQKELNREKQINDKLDHRERLNNFKSYLAQKFKPKITDKSVFVAKKQNQILNKLSLEETNQKGNEYLSIAKKRKKRLSKTQINLDKSSEQIGTKSNYTPNPLKYPDYLAQFRKNISGQTNALQRILKQRRLSTRKMQEVIRLIKQKQQGTKIGLHKGLIKNQFNTALQKINILNSMYQEDKQLSIQLVDPEN